MAAAPINNGDEGMIMAAADNTIVRPSMRLLLDRLCMSSSSSTDTTTALTTLTLRNYVMDVVQVPLTDIEVSALIAGIRIASSVSAVSVAAVDEDEEEEDDDAGRRRGRRHRHRHRHQLLHKLSFRGVFRDHPNRTSPFVEMLSSRILSSSPSSSSSSQDGSTTCCHVTLLDLSSCHLTARDAITIARSLPSNHYLLRLDLYGNNIGVEGAKALAKGLTTTKTTTTATNKQSPALQSIRLDFNNIGSEGCLALVKASKHCQLRRLEVGYNNIVDIESIAEELGQSPSCGNGGGGGGGGIQSIDFTGNRIGDHGAACLAECLVQQQKQQRPPRNYSSSEGKNNPSSYYHHLPLKNLNLTSTGIGDRGCDFLACGLRINSTLEHLDVGGNPITSNGVLSLIRSIQYSNYTLVGGMYFDNNGGGGGRNNHNHNAVITGLLDDNMGVRRIFLRHYNSHDENVDEDSSIDELPASTSSNSSSSGSSSSIRHDSIPPSVWRRVFSLVDEKPELFYLLLQSNPILTFGLEFKLRTPDPRLLL